MGLFEHKGTPSLLAPEDLDDPTLRKAAGRVELPFHIRWSGPAISYDLDDRADRMRVLTVPSGMLVVEVLDEQRREQAIRTLSHIFDVNPVVARIRTNEIYPAETGQLRL